MLNSRRKHLLRWPVLLLSLLPQLFSLPDLQARQIAGQQSLRIKVLSPELGEDPQTGTVVERDIDGLNLTLALDHDPQMPVILPAGTILELYRSKGKNSTGGFVTAGLVLSLGWIGFVKVAGGSSSTAGLGVLWTPLAFLAGGVLFGGIFAPEEWERIQVMTFFSEPGMKRTVGLGLRIGF